ncbi:MAG TPA: ATP-binding protein [Candidatus Polarisedimenticolaceae bacterium]
MSARARRILRWSAIAALAFGGLWTAYRSAERLAEEGPQVAANRLVLTALTLVIVVLAIGFVGVLIRNVALLILERRRGVLGSRLRTKLVFFFLALVLLPALLLSYGAAAFLKTTVDTLLANPVEEVVRESRELVDEAGREEESRALRLAARLAQEAATIPPGETSRRLEAWLSREGGDAAAVVRPAGEPEVAGRDPEARRLVGRLAEQAASSGGTVFTVEPVGDAFLVHAAVPWRGYDADGRPKVFGAAAVGTLARREIAARMERIAAAEVAYRQFRDDRRSLLRLYYSLVAVIGLATMFVASWVGLSIARRITIPVQQVAAAAREIAGGNLGVRVETKAQDEVATLVEAFNEMAADIQESNRQLEERRRYVETLIAALSSGVVSVDHEGRITTSNPAFAAIAGAPAPPGEPLRACLAAPGLAPLLAVIDDVLASGSRADRRELVIHVRGIPVAVSAHVARLHGARGEDLGTLLVVEDLTELLRAQKALAWQEVARRVAHEIKNPLTPIQLSAQRLRKKFAEGAEDLPEVVAAATGSIEHEVAALKRLVDEFSRYARLPEPVPEPVDAGAIVDSVAALYSGHRGVAIEREVDPALGIVRVDPEQIRGVLVNLFDNAVAALSGKGRIRVAAKPWNGPGSLRLEVEDDGPGVPAAVRGRLFEPYFSMKRRGTGLGLAIVHRVVTEHGGTIRVEDGTWGGLRFVIEIPAPPGPAPAGAAREA